MPHLKGIATTRFYKPGEVPADAKEITVSDEYSSVITHQHQILEAEAVGGLEHRIWLEKFSPNEERTQAAHAPLMVRDPEGDESPRCGECVGCYSGEPCEKETQ